MTARPDNDDEPPSLAALLRKFGNSFGAVTAEDWHEYDRAMAEWQLRRRDRYGGALTPRLNRNRRKAS
jgi:hypothetical protein